MCRPRLRHLSRSFAQTRLRHLRLSSLPSFAFSIEAFLSTPHPAAFFSLAQEVVGEETHSLTVTLRKHVEVVGVALCVGQGKRSHSDQGRDCSSC